MNKGIAIAGNMLVDKIKMIDVYPSNGMLANILEQKMSVGGLVPNTAIDLAKLDNTVKISAVGKIGQDDNGDFIIQKLLENNIDIENIIKIKDKDTSFTDVMTVKSNGKRTFFHCRGTNAEFKPEDINFNKLNCDIFHIGYALLLDKFDQTNEEYGTELAKTLYLAQQEGFLTSIDVVSEQSNRFKKIVSCSLKYCDYITLNEIESSNVCGLPLRDEKENIIEENLQKVCDWFLNNGVKKQICIHFPEGCAAKNYKGEYRQMPSLNLPKEYIKGTVGAGDAFCAGILYSAYKNFNLNQSLKIAVCAAACNLSCEDSIGGMKNIEQTLKLADKYNFRKEIKII